MDTFVSWLKKQNKSQFLWDQLAAFENFFPIDADAYDHLFNVELKKLIALQQDHHVVDQLEKLKTFKWTDYIRTSVRRAGVVRGERDIDATVHDVCSKLLTGSLFNYDPSRHGPFDRRFKVSVANAIRNVRQKRGTQQRRFPSISIYNEPGSIPPDEIAAKSASGNPQSVDQFRAFVRSRLGDFGVRVLNLRLNGGDVKSLVDVEQGITSYQVKEAVKSIKRLARDFAKSNGDDELVWRIDRLMNAEKKTLEKRFADASVGDSVGRPIARSR